MTKETFHITGSQQKIIEAAIEIFAEKGYSASSTSQIAKKAGVAEGTIFRHYRTKKELLLSIVGPYALKVFVPKAINDFEQVFTDDYSTFEDFLRAAFSNRITLVEKNQSVIKIIIQELPFHPEIREQVVQLIEKNILPLIEAKMIHFQQTGDIAIMPVPEVMRLIISPLIGYVISTYFLFPNANHDDQTGFESTIQFIVKGLHPSVSDAFQFQEE